MMRWLVPVVVLSATSCASILGISDYESDGAGGGAGAASPSSTASTTGPGQGSTTGANASTTTATATATTTTTTDAATTATSTADSSSASTGGSCVTSAACYTGAAGTENVGLCKGGRAVCDANNDFLSCDGEVVPQVEDCNTWQNESCTLDCAELAGAVRTLGGSSDDYPTTIRVIQPNGDVVFTGAHYAGATPIDLGNGPLDDHNLDNVFLAARYAADGTALWSGLHYVSGDYVSISASGTIFFAGFAQEATTLGSLSLAAGDFFFARMSGTTGAVVSAERAPGEIAGLDGDYVVMRNANGAWELRRYGGALTTPSSTTQIGGGSFGVAGVKQLGNDAIVYGTFTGTVTIGGTMLTTTGTDGFVGRVNNGAFTSVHKLGIIGGLGIGAMSTSSGTVFLGGAFNGSLPDPGNPATPNVSQTGADPYVCRFGAAANALQPIWCRGYGTPSQNAGMRSLDVDVNGNVLAALGKGLASIRADGSLRWLRSVPDQIGVGQAVTYPMGVLFAFTFAGSGVVDPFGEPMTLMGVGGQSDEIGLARFVLP